MLLIKNTPNSYRFLEAVPLVHQRISFVSWRPLHHVTYPTYHVTGPKED